MNCDEKINIIERDVCVVMRKILSVLLVCLLLFIPIKTQAVTDLSGSAAEDTSFEIVSEDNISVAASSVPFGYVDSIGPGGVSGWAWISSTPNTPIDVHTYVTNTSGVNRFYATTANIFRQDLYNLGYGNGYHAFSKNIDWRIYTPGTYTVTSYGIGGGNPVLNNTPTTYTVRPCDGYVDTLSSSKIEGWVWKPDEPNMPIDVHIYIYRPNGEQVEFFARTANIYREDLYTSNHGNGKHGFSINVNWSKYPEERLYLVFYAVDGSGYNDSFWTAHYDNRKPINLLGMVDEKGRKFHTAFATPMSTWCENIGCTDVNIHTGADNQDAIDIVKDSSYSVIFTHGSPTTLEMRLGNSEVDLTATEIGSLTDGYFDSTRCLLIMACEVGYGGANYDNVVNAFYNKGIDTVIGFKDETWFSFYNDSTSANYGNMVLTKGSPCWIRTFTQRLGEGKTVNEAIYDAFLEATKTPGSGFDDDGNPVPADYGLGSVYVAGNINQVVKH